MSGPSLDHLRTFVTVFRAGSQTKAADLLGISQPTVSAHIGALEETLGFALFVRTPAGVEATEKGAELAREVAEHLDAIEDSALLSGLSGVTPESPRALHIGGPAELLSELVLPRLDELADAARVPLRFRFGLADELLDLLASRALDLVVSAVRPRVRGITAVPAYDEEFVLVAAPAWAGREVDAIPVVAYAEHLPIVRRYWRSVFDRRPDQLELVAVIPDLRGIRSAVVAGVGMSVLPRYLVDADLASGALVQLDEPEVAPLNTVYLATRAREAERDAHLGATVAQLRRMLG
ncbi:LysR family transcriptional regulator [Agromyces bauzanensis]